MSERQEMLVEIELPAPVTKMVPLRDLPATQGIRVKALEDSMLAVGQLVPIIVVQRGPDPYLVAGRRRVAAARELGWDEIRAEVYKVPLEADLASLPVLTLIENAERAANPIVEARAVRDLFSQGYDLIQIARETGMTPALVKKRLALSDLPAPLLSGVEQGQVALGVAESVVKLPPTLRERALVHFQEEGVLKQKDVDEMRRVERQAEWESWLGRPMSLAPDATEDPLKQTAVQQHLSGVVDAHLMAAWEAAVSEVEKAAIRTAMATIRRYRLESKV